MVDHCERDEVGQRSKTELDPSVEPRKESRKFTGVRSLEDIRTKLRGHVNCVNRKTVPTIQDVVPVIDQVMTLISVAWRRPSAVKKESIRR